MQTRLMIHLLSYLLVLVACLSFVPPPPIDAQKPARITGTYTNMSYNKEAGDVLGYEIKIVYTGDGYQGALQIAEGTPGKIILVDVQSVGVKISFSIPASSSHAGQFIGTVENGMLKGEFRFKSGGTDKVELRKGKSYWD